ncbi:hypothetical protein BBO99_00007886 [Phytophthora kernoviae]|uniref:RxLR effector protein n=2 Tax=Phytophthora kernoviae TaxID=325452 RepID=A0A3R7NBY4_9STRA|nr:hypothetical protein G195_008809 [Phytophthora kernoviae 00238/432]RLN45406.1 hypothetical protein BBI17_007823 [Phytophthora kernoviae]RLN76015.1 hypothetical protein BBO99_00007886 [Phytophthora kernoviae]
MRLSCFLFAVATALLASFDAVSATSDMGHVALSKVDSVHSASVINGNGDDNRFLRTSKVIEEEDNDSGEDLEDDTEDDFEDEERAGLLDLFKNLPLNKLNDMAADLAKTNPGALKEIRAENVKMFQKIKDLGWTPASMAEKLGIAGKRATMSKAALKNDPDYLLFRQYETLDSTETCPKSIDVESKHAGWVLARICW